MRFFSLVATAAMISVPFKSPAAPVQHRHLMMVVSKRLPGVTIYDADSEEKICDAYTGISPHEAAFSRDGRYAYIPVYGSGGVGGPGTNEHMLHFIRTSDCKEIGALDTGKYERPHGISVGRSGTIYLTSEIQKSVLLIDPKTQKIIAAIPTDSQYSHMIAVTRDEKTIYVSNVQSKTVSVLNIPSRKLERVIPVEAEDQRMTLSPDEKWFVTNLGPISKIGFFQTAECKLDFYVPVDGEPFVAKFSADGEYLYDAGTKNGEIRAWKVDVSQRKVVATSEGLGRGIGSLAVNPFNGRVYVSADNPSRVIEIDPTTWKVVKYLETAKVPDCMVFTTVR